MSASRRFQTGMAGLLVWLTLSAGVAAQSRDTLEIRTAAASERVLGEAEALLAGNDAAAAYAMLAPLETDLAGNAYYDYLLGVAALDTGRTGEAIFSLERALVVEPRFSGAKMELARAFFEIGETDQARPLFAALLDEEPPPGVRDVLLRYIDAIDAQPVRAALRFDPWAEVGAGYDSNANGSPSDAMFLGFVLSPENVETDSPFAAVAAGFNLTAPAGDATTWFAGGRAGHRANPDADFVDSSLVSAIGGLAFRRGAFYGRIGTDGYLAYRDGSSNQDYLGLEGLLGRRLGERLDLELSLRAGALRHDDAIDVLDVDRLLYTLGAAWRLSPLANARVEVLGGSDNERRDASPYGNSKLGGRVTLNFRSGNRSLLFSVGSLTSDYDGLFFGSAREDTQRSAILEVQFSDVFIEGLSLLPAVRYTDNDSDIDLYAYERTEVGLTIRWMPR